MKDNHVTRMPNRLKLKTYSHLGDRNKIPSEYEIVSSDMLYYVKKGKFEVKTPISDWYEKYQKNSGIIFSNWEKFNDPKCMTYFSYIKNQKKNEIFFEASFNNIENSNYDQQLNKEWLDILDQIFAPLRYPLHGMQMLASYLGSMAPEGKIAITCAFQTLDEMRRIQFIAYRMRQFQNIYPEFGKESLNIWQNNSAWQPLRKCVEQLLVTYNWLECFIALNLVLKPIFDYFILICLPRKGLDYNDTQLEILAANLWEDSLWHQSWSLSLLDLILNENIGNKKIIEVWLKKWLEVVTKAILPMSTLLFADSTEVCNPISYFYKEFLKNSNLRVKLQW